jgi:hypothetical protein
MDEFARFEWKLNSKGFRRSLAARRSLLKEVEFETEFERSLKEVWRFY